MITDQHREEQLSRAYVHAVAAHAGLIFEPASQDYGVDGTIKAVTIMPDGRRFVGGYNLDVQLKATTNWKVSNNEIVYDLEAKTYNDLVDRFNEDRATPMVLAVLCLPVNQTNWLSVSLNELALRNCCYWCQVGKTKTTNAATKRIKIPQGNILNQSTMTALMQKVKNGVAL